MTNFGLKISDIEYIKKIFGKFPEVKEALIFGSRAMGNYKSGSDIDLCLKGEQITLELVAKIKSLLQDEGPLPYQIDIVAYHIIESEKLKNHINTFGKIILAK